MQILNFTKQQKKRIPKALNKLTDFNGHDFIKEHQHEIREFCITVLYDYVKSNKEVEVSTGFITMLLSYNNFLNALEGKE